MKTDDIIKDINSHTREYTKLKDTLSQCKLVYIPNLTALDISSGEVQIVSCRIGLLVYSVFYTEGDLLLWIHEVDDINYNDDGDIKIDQGKFYRMIKKCKNPYYMHRLKQKGKQK